ncbi:MAG: primosomal protein N' family DNA-binding protein, partial [Planctomycetota bacterium]
MSRYRTDSLFADVDSRFRGNNKPVVYNHIIRVVFESAADAQFDYAVPDELWPIRAGQRVEVPFGKKNKLQTGFCVAVEGQRQSDKGVEAQSRERRFKLKSIEKVIDDKPLVDSELMELARWISSYYVCPLGQVLAAMVPSAVKRGAGVKTQKYIYLAEGVDEAIEQLRGKKQKQIVEYLHGRGALNSENALELQGVLEAIGCGKEPVKRLAEKQIVKIAQRTILKSLPAIPKGFLIKTERIVLNEDQRKALVHIKDEINSGKFGVTLLHGVTDSGKTELYMRAIEAVLQKNASAIVLLPEIALTAQTVQRFNERFKKIAVMHSGLTAAQRNVQWQKIKAGQADVVIGARSAVFAPVP